MRNIEYDLEHHKKSDTVKWVAIFLAVILLAVGVMAAITMGFSDWNPYGWFGDKESEKGEVVDDEGNRYESGVTYPMPSNMLFSAPSAMSETASEGITLKAKIEPEDASNQTVDWSVEFVNGSSSWATGKTAEDYLTVTPTTDGSLTATIACAEAFGEQITITVTSRDNPDAKATCRVDYVRRLTGFDLVVSAAEGKNDGFSVASQSQTPVVMPVYLGSGDLTRNLSLTKKWSVGTVDDTITMPETFTFTPTDTFVNAANEYGLDWNDGSGADLPIASGIFSGDNFLNYFHYDGESIGNQSLEIKNKLFRALNASAENGVAEVVFQMTGKYSGTVTETYLISVSNMKIEVTGVILDQTTLVF